MSPGLFAAAPDADEIVRRHLEAIGGARWEKVQSLLVKGSGPVGSFVWVWKRPGKFRSEERDDTYSGKTLVTAFDGTTAWIADPFKGPATPRRMKPDEQQRWQNGFVILSDLLDLPSTGVSVQLLGQEPVNQRPAWKLSLNRPGREEVTLWIDAETYYLVQRARVLTAPWGEDRNVVQVLSDYRKVDGVVVAHAVGPTHCVVAVNAEIADSMFRPSEPLE
ncbi:MAG: hypothetical protein QOH21_1953 [Acidobacteriota bacterium]|jgi:outer membrane lipoprotein-sorting protein|nr:hypothetical protein [Acidobacteriota bacterium]